ncbi:MAG: tRNA 2-thiocytidine biosynthesis protein TtcA [Clostridia bacterium]|nr:tRNA 2-thiocytidine biosynthesis protein TtcA [Clostridia bacterium]MBQ9343534.1 tRNA 2-thiocytidine biosynthesis protein TtcA [Clostridia bacterium]
MSRNFTPAQMVEQSIIRTYHDELWNPFCKAIKRYELICPGDRIAVCISGGKDSMLMAVMMRMLQRHSEVPFDVEYLIMDPGYNQENRRLVEKNAQFLELPYTIYESDIFEIANVQEKNPCFLCARMRRGCLYKKAQEMGCNKIALGHHFDDVIGTTLIGMFYGGQLQAMIPKLKSKNFPGMELIRPMYMVHEEDILTWKEANNLEFIQCACRFTENDAIQHDSKRQEIKQLIRSLREDNPNIERNIFASIHMLQLDMMVSWKYKGKEYSFLDRYDEE